MRGDQEFRGRCFSLVGDIGDDGNEDGDDRRVVDEAGDRAADADRRQQLFVEVVARERGHLPPEYLDDPVWLMPELRMSIASTVIVAEFEKPEVPSAVEISVKFTTPSAPRTISNTIIRMAVTSTGSSSVTNNTSARPMIPKTTSISGVTVSELESAASGAMPVSSGSSPDTVDGPTSLALALEGPDSGRARSRPLLTADRRDHSLLRCEPRPKSLEGDVEHVGTDGLELVVIGQIGSDGVPAIAGVALVEQDANADVIGTADDAADGLPAFRTAGIVSA